MTSHPVLKTIDAFAQEVQGKLSQAEVGKCAATQTAGYAVAYAETEAYLWFGNMLSTIRAQVEDMIEEQTKGRCRICGKPENVAESLWCAGCYALYVPDGSKTKEGP